MIRLKIGLEIKHDKVITVCVTEDKTAMLLFNVSRNPVRFKALGEHLSMNNFATLPARKYAI